MADALDRLRGLVDGELRLPSDDGFAARTRPYNDRFAGVRPASVLSVRHADDVGRAIGWARDHGVPVVPRGSGHSYAGHSVVPDSLVLDLGALNEVVVEPDTGLVTVGGGTPMGTLYAALRRHDLAFPLGNSDNVAIGGLVLGGGVAVTSRSAGLTCDSLLATDVVVADGSLLRCDDTTNTDLFWACRGGGGGNFGVNASFTFQARPVRACATCLVLWDSTRAAEILVTMQKIMRAAPDEFAARIGVTSAGVVSVVGQHMGSAAELRELLAPALAVARPSRLDVMDRDYWDAVAFLRHDTAGGAFAVRTRCTPTPLTEEAVDTALAALQKWPGSTNPDGAGFALFTWGGAISRIPVADTAFALRDVLFLLSMDTSWSDEDAPDVVRDNVAWLTDFHDRMRDFTADESYVNFADPDLTNWANAYYGPNLARLAAVKRRYDPDRVFDFPQVIQPAQAEDQQR